MIKRPKPWWLDSCNSVSGDPGAVHFGAACRWPREWTVSVRRRAPYLGPTFGLFDPTIDLRGERNEGLAPAYMFGPYRENPSEFTCELEDDWDVATLLRFVFHEQ